MRRLQRLGGHRHARAEAAAGDGADVGRTSGHEVGMATRRHGEPDAGHDGRPAPEQRAERLDLIEFFWTVRFGVQLVLYIERRLLH